MRYNVHTGNKTINHQHRVMQTVKEQYHSKVLKDLVGQIKNCTPGQKFMSQREMMNKYNISQRVVESLLGQLAAKNIISIVPGRGVFIKDPSKQKVKHILFLYPDWPSISMLELVRNLENAANQTKRVTLYKQTFPYNKLEVDRIDPQGIDAIIIKPPSEDLDIAQLNKLSSLNIPVIMLDKNLESINISSAYGHDDMSGLYAASYLINNGHKDIAILISEPHISNTMNRCTSFCKYAELNGCNVEIIDCKVLNGENSEDKSYEVMNNYLKKNKLNFTGLFVISDMTALSAMKAISENGYDIPGDISIVGHGGLNQGKFFSPALTTVKINQVQLFTRLFQKLENFMSESTKKYFHIGIEPEILIRDSVRKI